MLVILLLVILYSYSYVICYIIVMLYLYYYSILLCYYYVLQSTLAVIMPTSVGKLSNYEVVDEFMYSVSPIHWICSERFKKMLDLTTAGIFK